jgi:hypothetical protein
LSASSSACRGQVLVDYSRITGLPHRCTIEYREVIRPWCRPQSDRPAIRRNTMKPRSHAVQLRRPSGIDMVTPFRSWVV